MAPSLDWAHLFLLFLAAERGLELVIARRNEQRVKALGGREFDVSFTRLLISFHVLWFASFALEAFAGHPTGHAPPVLIGLAFLLFQSWRYWCITSLEGFWNTKVIVLPGAERKRKGPYRWIRHPNYIVVLLELFLYPAFFGCWVTALLFGTANIFVLRRRIQRENLALELMKG
jgi:methyltransferase